MNAKQAYILAKKYTDDTAVQFGGLKGAPAKILSVVKKDGQNIITFGWDNDLGEHQETKIYVDDGTPIYTWEPDTFYDYGALVIYESSFYRCIYENSDHTFNPLHWDAINSTDGSYGLVETHSELPERFSHADRKMYYVIDEQIFYLWDGYEWTPQNPAITNDEIDNLFI